MGQHLTSSVYFSLRLHLPNYIAAVSHNPGCSPPWMSHWEGVIRVMARLRRPTDTSCFGRTLEELASLAA